MKISAPVTVTPDVLVSSNVSETIVPAWDVGTAYSVGNNVSYQRRIYEALIDSTGVTPGSNQLDTSGNPYWLDLGSTNRWAMFDGESRKATQNPSLIDVTLASPTLINAVSVLNFDTTTLEIIVTSAVDGEVYREEIDTLETSNVNDFYDWFFAPIERISDVTRTDLPAYTDAEIRIVATAVTGNVKIGEIVIGRIYEIGVTGTGTSTGILDNSRKEVDQFGNATLQELPFSDTADYRVLIDNSRLPAVKRLLSNFRARPLVFIGSELQSFSPTVVYGFIREFDINISYPTYSDLTLGVEELAGSNLEQTFTDIVLLAPEVLSPTQNEVVETGAPTLTGTALETIPNGILSHVETDWRIATDTGFANIVWQTTTTSPELEETRVPAETLDTSTVYYLQIRHKASNGEYAPWSQTRTFETSNVLYVYPGAAVINAFRSPGSQCVSATYAGSFLVTADAALDRIYVHNGTSASIVTSFPSPTDRTGDMAWDGNNLWIMLRNESTGQSRVYQMDGLSRSVKSLVGLIDETNAITILDNRFVSIYVNASRQRVLRFHTGLNNVTDVEYVIPTNSNFALTTDGVNLIAVDRTSVYVFDQTGTLLSDYSPAWPAGSINNFGVAFNGSNVVITNVSSDNNGNSICVLNTSATPIND